MLSGGFEFVPVHQKKWGFVGCLKVKGWWRFDGVRRESSELAVNGGTRARGRGNELELVGAASEFLQIRRRNVKREEGSGLVVVLVLFGLTEGAGLVAVWGRWWCSAHRSSEETETGGGAGGGVISPEIEFSGERGTENWVPPVRVVVGAPVVGVNRENKKNE